MFRDVFFYRRCIRCGIKEAKARIKMIYIDGELLDLGSVTLAQIAKLFVLFDQTGDGVGTLVFCHPSLL